MRPGSGIVVRPWCNTCSFPTVQKQAEMVIEIVRTFFSAFEKRLKPVYEGLVRARDVFQLQLALVLKNRGLAYVVEPPSISKSTLGGGLIEGHRPNVGIIYPSKTAVPNGLVEELPPKNRSHKVLARGCEYQD